MMTRKERRARYALPAAALSALATLFSGITLVGHPARLVHVLALFASSFAAGLTTAKALAGRKAPAAIAAESALPVQPRDKESTEQGGLN